MPFHIYFETGAIGDTALNLCRAHIGMKNRNLQSCVVHTSPIFKFGDPKIVVPSNPDVIEIIKNTNFIQEIVYDIDYDKAESFKISKKYNCPIYQPNEFRNYHNIKEWVNLEKYLLPIEIKKKLAIFQPISLKYKPIQHLEDYIPVWKRCLEALLAKDYHIVMVGGPEDQIELCVPNEIRQYLDNKIQVWSPLNSLAFLLYQADFILSCDSWAAIWGAAARKHTAIAWGYRMENNIDFWVTGFLGNQDCYKYGWSSQKEFCDIYLSDFIREKA